MSLLLGNGHSDILADLIEKCLTSTCFLFQGKYFQETADISVGLPSNCNAILISALPFRFLEYAYESSIFFLHSFYRCYLQFFGKSHQCTHFLFENNSCNYYLFATQHINLDHEDVDYNRGYVNFM